MLLVWSLVVMLSLKWCNSHYVFIFELIAAFFWSSLAIIAGGKPPGALGTILLIILIKFRMSKHTGGGGFYLLTIFFRVVIVVFAAVSFVTSTSVTGKDFPSPNYDWCNASKTNENCTEYHFPLHGTRNAAQYYPACSMSWPMAGNDTVHDNCPDDRLTIVDLAHMSRLVYHASHQDNAWQDKASQRFSLFSNSATMLRNESRNESRCDDVADDAWLRQSPYNEMCEKTSADVQVYIDKNLPGWCAKCQIHQNQSLGSKSTFIYLRRKGGNTKVVAIRGTNSAAEVFQDFTFFLPAAFLQISNFIANGGQVFDLLMGWITFNVNDCRQDEVRTIHKFVRKLTQNRTDSMKIYLTGHSLGGFLAALVGSNLSVEAITFSAPGIDATSKIMFPDANKTELARNTHRLVTNVVPETDLVPAVDMQTGTVVPISCNIKNPGDCHLLVNTMCELMAACGDGGGRNENRNYSQTCSNCRDGGQAFESRQCPTVSTTT